VIFDLRIGEWQAALAGVDEVDATIFDAPYSRKVHDGNDGLAIRDNLGYAATTPAQAAEHVAHWSPRTRGWMVSITSHDLWPAWATAMEAEGRYVFSPIPLIDEGMTVRLRGDGPSSWTCWLCVGRPRSLASWGTLRGAYRRRAGDPRSPRRGGKPLGVMREIVRDYSRPGDLVLDTHAGGGTTLLAAMLEGRRALGAEVDEDAWHDARERCEPHIDRCTSLLGVQAGRTLNMFE
jgi:site-specific DNA-methyltransferase (adenine-specific)